MTESAVSKRQWLLKACFAVCLACVTTIMILASGNKHGYSDIMERGKLTIVTRNSPTTYYEDKDQPAGFEYELASMFADYLGVELEVKVAHTLDDLLNQVASGNVAMAAAGLTVTDEREKYVTFADSYMNVTQKLVYRVGSGRPQNIEDLVGKRIVVIADSSHSQYLRDIQKNHLPKLSWMERNDAEVVELVQMVENGEIDYTIVDSNELDAIDNFYPNVASAFTLGEDQQLAWAFAKYSDHTLIAKARDFFNGIRETGLLSQLEERHYGHLRQFDNVGTLTFLQQADERLHKYQNLFQEQATEHMLDWRLLAAIGYQESHWRPHARSRTGVRGLMMLTLNTAKEVGVKNRLDPTQSIEGGSAYFAKLHNRFEHIAEPDRTWLALASYNVGAGHVRDAQDITAKQGGDPERWMDVKERLPLLAQKKWYKHTRHGYARGHEPVKYVQNIRRFYDLLVWRDQPDTQIAEQRDEDVIFTASNGYQTIGPLIN